MDSQLGLFTNWLTSFTASLGDESADLTRIENDMFSVPEVSELDNDLAELVNREELGGVRRRLLLCLIHQFLLEQEESSSEEGGRALSHITERTEPNTSEDEYRSEDEEIVPFKALFEKFERLSLKTGEEKAKCQNVAPKKRVSWGSNDSIIRSKYSSTSSLDDMSMADVMQELKESPIYKRLTARRASPSTDTSEDSQKAFDFMETKVYHDKGDLNKAQSFTDKVSTEMAKVWMAPTDEAPIEQSISDDVHNDAGDDLPDIVDIPTNEVLDDINSEENSEKILEEVFGHSCLSNADQQSQVQVHKETPEEAVVDLQISNKAADHYNDRKLADTAPVSIDNGKCEVFPGDYLFASEVLPNQTQVYEEKLYEEDEYPLSDGTVKNFEADDLLDTTVALFEERKSDLCFVDDCQDNLVVVEVHQKQEQVYEEKSYEGKSELSVSDDLTDDFKTDELSNTTPIEIYDRQFDDILAEEHVGINMQIHQEHEHEQVGEKRPYDIFETQVSEAFSVHFETETEANMSAVVRSDNVETDQWYIEEHQDLSFTYRVQDEVDSVFCKSSNESDVELSQSDQISNETEPDDIVTEDFSSHVLTEDQQLNNHLNGTDVNNDEHTPRYYPYLPTTPKDDPPNELLMQVIKSDETGNITLNLDQSSGTSHPDVQLPSLHLQYETDDTLEIWFDDESCSSSSYNDMTSDSLEAAMSDPEETEQDVFPNDILAVVDNIKEPNIDTCEPTTTSKRRVWGVLKSIFTRSKAESTPPPIEKQEDESTPQNIHHSIDENNHQEPKLGSLDEPLPICHFQEDLDQDVLDETPEKGSRKTLWKRFVHWCLAKPNGQVPTNQSPENDPQYLENDLESLHSLPDTESLTLGSLDSTPESGSYKHQSILPTTNDPECSDANPRSPNIDQDQDCIQIHAGLSRSLLQLDVQDNRRVSILVEDRLGNETSRVLISPCLEPPRPQTFPTTEQELQIKLFLGVTVTSAVTAFALSLFHIMQHDL